MTEAFKLKLDWLTFKMTPWEKTKVGDELTLFQKRYYVKRHDGLPINVFVTALPSDAGFILGDLEICASRAMRSYEGCHCTMDGACKAHDREMSVSTFRGVPDLQANDAQGLRDFLEAQHAS